MEKDIQKILDALPEKQRKLFKNILSHHEKRVDFYKESSSECQQLKTELEETQNELMEVKHKLTQCKGEKKLAEEQKQELATDLCYLLWIIESCQLAEGARQYFHDLVLQSMSPCLRKFVNKDMSFASLVDLAISNQSGVDPRVLGFSVSELSIVSKGFQFVSDRRNEQGHPTQRLASLTVDKRSDLHRKLMDDVIGGASVSPQLKKAFEDSQQFSRSKLVERERLRKHYEATLQPSSHSARLHNTAVTFQHSFEKDGKLPARILPHQKKRSRPRDASLCPEKKRQRTTDS